MLFLVSDGSRPSVMNVPSGLRVGGPARPCSCQAWFAVAHSAPLSSGLSGVAGYQRRMVEVGDMSPVLLPQLDFF